MTTNIELPAEVIDWCKSFIQLQADRDELIEAEDYDEMFEIECYQRGLGLDISNFIINNLKEQS